MSSDRRVFVLDTNVLLSFGVPALHAFQGAEVVVPLVVVSEVQKKRDDVGLASHARAVLKELNSLISVGDPDAPVRVELNHVDTSQIPPAALKSLSTNDGRILTVAYNLKNEDGGRDVTLVTEDIMLSIGAQAVGVPVEGFNPGKRDGYRGYASGQSELIVARKFLDQIYKSKLLEVSIHEIPELGEVVNNTFVILRSAEGPGSALTFATTHPETGDYRLELLNSDAELFGVSGKSKEQKFAVDLLRNEDIKVVSLGGKAGTGKTFLALMAGLDQIFENQDSGIEKVTVFRPVQAVGGQELGFLPGTQDEKMSPWGQAIYDALESELSAEVREEIAERGLLEILPLTHIRGRSLHNRWVIIDEAQNLDLPSILAVLTRTGQNTKVILNWDESQRDNPHVSRFNGIVEAVNRMYGHSLFGHVTLTKSERSDVAEMAAQLLDN